MTAANDLDGRISQAWGGTNPNGVHLNVVLARRGSATAATMAGTLTGPAPGFTPILVCVGEDQPSYRTVYPPTIMLNKTESPSSHHGTLVSGACQVGIAQGVLDTVADGAVAADQETLVFAAVWLNPDADTGNAVRQAAREAMRKGVLEAVGADGAPAQPVSERDRLTHPFYPP